MTRETVIGLEVHVELGTKTKMFCSCTAAFGGEPNTHCCPVCLGLPGALPAPNREAVEYAVRSALALGCRINRKNVFDRKNYFYPDLPKAYQISQLYVPLGVGGGVDITLPDGTAKRIGIHEIHMEEDAGKLIHSGGNTLIDFNRCGVPLIEIVSEPDMRSAYEVTAYLTAVRSTLEYLGVSDVKMQEGSLRADINISVRIPGGPLGTRTELKNLNSFRAIERAIAYEEKRQNEILDAGGAVEMQTRRWDEDRCVTVAMRAKEDAREYRYFPEPDIPPVEISEADIARYMSEMPEFAGQKARRYEAEYGMSHADAELIAGSGYLANLFEGAVGYCNNAKEVLYWMKNQVLYLMNERGIPADSISLSPVKFAEFVDAVARGRINRVTGRTVFEAMFDGGEDFDVGAYITENRLEQVNDAVLIAEAVKETIDQNPKALAQYKNGETKITGFFIGRAMKRLGGRGDPDAVRAAVGEELDKR